MKLIKQDIDKRTGFGSAVLLPEEPEDMWHAYNLISPNDLVRASAIRRVQQETAVGSTTSNRVHTVLTLRVTSTDFDSDAGQLHVSGRVAEENRFVKLGAYHTLDLELNRNFTLIKGDESGGVGSVQLSGADATDRVSVVVGGWDSIALATLEEATDARRRAQIWAVVMQDGLANICLITEHQTLLRQRVEVPIPRKRRGGQSEQDKALAKFFDTVLSTLLRHMELPPVSAAGSTAASGGATAKKRFNTNGIVTNHPPSTPPSASTSDPTVLPLLLASPGFTASAFHTYIKETAQRSASKPLLALLLRVLVAHSSTGHMHSLAEVIASPSIASKLADTRYARESGLMDRFFKMLRLDDGRATYGPREVENAVEKGACGRGGGVLLISNALFRSNNVAERRRWVTLVDKVKEMEGGEVRVLSSAHESGKRLESLGGVAAILTFAVEEEDEDNVEDIANISDG
ncbi:eRF1 domain 1-domain-containing protein [Lineolata rhizophorae]|uniref:ERF1 domain 1-domain-containing protein n=1 Tax=Lineolata rhizophorae TaxID=578093 RepID=A0A6A6P3S7_9PEZI|nr:eRF1 domain 1-domain-containing protein [Lineolata rhizophorae]